METQRLRDPDTFPDKEILLQALGASFPAYEKLLATVSSPSFGLLAEWRYYRDGGAWLCKVTHRKKTIFWLSVWKEFFKTTFYFTERTRQGILSLDIEARLKEELMRDNFIGKLIPLTFNIRSVRQVEDILKVATYKKSLK